MVSIYHATYGISNFYRIWSSLEDHQVPYWSSFNFPRNENRTKKMSSRIYLPVPCTHSGKNSVYEHKNMLTSANFWETGH